MTRIFISYRRADSRLVTNRIYDRLVIAFGREDIFKDVDDIPPGRDFRDVLREATASCEVMLVVIGPEWLDIREASDPDARRLDNPEDFVRLEVETGLQRDDIRLIPLLVEGAHMPGADELPTSLRELAFYNAFTIQDDPHFHRNMDSLINILQGDLPRQRSVRPWWIGAVVTLVILSIAAAILVPSLFNRPPSEQTKTPTNDVAALELTTEPPPTATDAPPSTPSQTATDVPSVPTLTRTPSDTPDFEALALTFDANLTETQAAIYQQETVTQRVALTATATQWTKTPTPDLTLEFINFLTERAAATQTQESGDQTATAASWTDTPTPTPTNTPTSTPFPTVVSNDQWTPVIQTFDGVEMVLVPPGCFMMGSDDGDPDEQPVNEVCFAEPFWIDRYEVTNGQYGSTGNWEGDNRPRENVSWFDALEHCQSRNAHLPTEAEWEYAARGPDNLVYPWGNEFVGDNVVYGENSDGQTAAVGSRPNGVSWVGAHDLSGNVWEWVSTIYDQAEFPYPYATDDGREDVNRTDVLHGLRGGSWNNGFNGVRSANRNRFNPDNVYIAIGFRCARDY